MGLDQDKKNSKEKRQKNQLKISHHLHPRFSLTKSKDVFNMVLPPTTHLPHGWNPQQKAQIHSWYEMEGEKDNTLLTPDRALCSSTPPQAPLPHTHHQQQQRTTLTDQTLTDLKILTNQKGNIQQKCRCHHLSPVGVTCASLGQADGMRRRKITEISAPRESPSTRPLRLLARVDGPRPLRFYR